MTRRRTPATFPLVTLALTSAQAAAQSDVVTTFNTDAQAWTSIVCNCGGNYSTVLNANPFTWESSPGADGTPGYLQAPDPFGNCNFFNAASAYLGDKSAYLNGRLLFSIRSNVTDWPNDNVVVLVSSAAPVLVCAVPLPNPTGTWINYTVRLSTAGEWRIGSKTGPLATPAQFTAALASLTALRLPSEFGATAPQEIVGLDSVTLTRSCGPADLGSQGGSPGGDGQLNNNDFIVFIDYFFASDTRADVGRQGGTPGPDGLFNNNDFIAYIDLFFAGC